MNKSSLYEKYDVPAPRYTSYPTVPYWSSTPTTEQWLDSVTRSLALDNMSWAMYIHMPFCESFCSYCACNTSATRDHGKEEEYVSAIQKEWDLYLTQQPLLSEKPLQQLHLGGGSPTFFSAKNLHKMLAPIISRTKISQDNFDASVEVDPRCTKQDQLESLYELGFSRISLGVQDFNYKVQQQINRIQPKEITEQLTLLARAIGYQSVNYDLIYGLPNQDLEAMQYTIDSTIALRPDRIALYSLAIVPWLKPKQRRYQESELPQGDEKRALYELAVEMLQAAGYLAIGMDHFALPHDSLAKAQAAKTLHRNFMGYTEDRSQLLIALGSSSISESMSCYHQNEKVLPVYLRRIQNSEIPTLRGHLLSQEDQIQKERILSLMTQHEIIFNSADELNLFSEALEPLVEDEIIVIENRRLAVTQGGKPFLRNIAMALDLRLQRDKPQQEMFSKAI